MSKLVKFAFVFLLTITSAAGGLAEKAFGGFIIEQVSYQKGDSTKKKGKIFIKNNRIKFVEEQNGQGVAIFDLNTGEMIQIDNTGKRYVVASPEDYFKFIQDVTNKMKTELENQLSQLPPEQRAQAEEMMKSQGITVPGQEKKPRNVTLKKTGMTDTIGGYKSSKYEIYEDGKLSEEIWISDDMGFGSELDIKKMANYMSEIKKISEKAGAGQPNWDEEEKIFKEIYESGFPTRSVDYSSRGAVFIEEIIKVNKAEISDMEFQPPVGYKKVTLQEIMQPSK
ncbi:MAG: DUF4412 domain-containing protein [Thermodesulfobacteriota bacterium]|jgi:hypothetical protein